MPCNNQNCMNAPTDTTSRRKIWFKRALYLFLIILMVTGIRAWQQRDMTSGMASPLVGVKLDGSAYALPAKSAQPVLVHFWATWCPVCRAEQDSINAISDDHPNTITVAMQSGSDEKVSQYLVAEGLHFPVLNDADGRISAAWGVNAVPASFIISPDGKISFVEVGFTTGVGLRLRLWLARLLS